VTEDDTDLTGVDAERLGSREHRHRRSLDSRAIRPDGTSTT
jgi:hypothetical protein